MCHKSHISFENLQIQKSLELLPYIIEKARTTSTMSGSTHCCLLDLPGELRNQIYRKILCYDGLEPEVISPDLYEHSPQDDWDTDSESPSSESPSSNIQTVVLQHDEKGQAFCTREQISLITIINILFTNKRIYHEALLIFWSSNTFLFSSLRRLLPFLKFIGIEQRRFLRKIGIGSQPKLTTNSSSVDYLNPSYFVPDKASMSLLDWPDANLLRTPFFRLAQGLQSTLDDLGESEEQRKDDESSSTGNLITDYDCSVVSSTDILGDAIRDSNSEAPKKLNRLLDTWSIKHEKLLDPWEIHLLEKTTSGPAGNAASESQALAQRHIPLYWWIPNHKVCLDWRDWS